VGSLASSTLAASKGGVAPGETLAYTFILRNTSLGLPAVVLTDTLPLHMTYAGGLSASSGVANYAAGSVTWSGAVNTGAPVTITFNVTVDPGLTAPTAIWNTAQIDDGSGNLLLRRALTIVNADQIYLPIIQR
jgi:uncharacterized repeat protein (TIGR01451 family)